MKDFAAIDFETANNERSSVCSVGIVIVRNGEIVDSFYSLIQPEPNYYNYWCSQVHGLCCVYIGTLVPVPSDRYVRYHAFAPRGTNRPIQRYHLGDILAYSGRYPFTNSGDIRSVRW